MESEFEMDVRQFLARPPFRFRNVPQDGLALFCAALTHDSYSNERGGESYERLEFLGDAILEFVVCDHVYSGSEGATAPRTAAPSWRRTCARTRSRRLWRQST